MKWSCTISTPLGDMIAREEENKLCGLWFAGQKYAPEEFGEWRENADRPVFAALRNQLEAYFAGQLQTFDLPLAPRGTSFQMEVWTLLRSIPSGETTTYGALSVRIAGKRPGNAPSAQAVGGAVGRNPIAIVIPCHRVVGANGSLTGYAGGLDRKATLLALERGQSLSCEASCAK